MVSADTKRVVVLAISVVLAVLSVLAIAFTYQSTLSLVFNILSLIASIFGFIGVNQMNRSYMGVFEVFLVVLSIFGIVSLVLDVQANTKTHNFLWSLLVTIALIVCAVFTHDLRAISPVVPPAAPVVAAPIV